jgi:hypothetical protein
VSVLGKAGVFPVTIPVSDTATVAFAGQAAMDQQALFRTLGISGVLTVSARFGGGTVCVPAFGGTSGSTGFVTPPSREILPNRSLFDAPAFLHSGGGF